MTSYPTSSGLAANHARPVINVALVFVLGCLVSTISAEDQQEALSKTIAAGAVVSSSPLWLAFVSLCVSIAPYCGIICFLAPLPTIIQISRDKAVGNLPLLPYSSMVSNGFLWFMYGMMKNLPSVWGCNAVGVLLGAYYCTIFVQHCGPMASNLPGTVGQHLRGVSGIILCNLCLAISGANNASDFIGKEGVFFCVIMFASPLAALKHVIVTRSAASIPLPFTVACFVNCLAWSVMGLWTMNDFNIYFPNLMGLIFAIAQLVLKGVYGNRANSAKDGLPK